MKICPDEKHRWEINAYHDLGYIMFRGGIFLQETNHGYKNERREATSIESDLWDRFAAQTPEIPVIKVNNDLQLNYKSFESFGIETQEKCVWLENEYEMALFACHKDYGGEILWRHYYTFSKEIRMPEGYERED